MFDYLLVYYLLTATSAAPPPSGTQVNNPVLVNRPGAVSAQERFTSLEQCQRRIEGLRAQAAQPDAVSERFELDCHPVQKSGASS